MGRRLEDFAKTYAGLVKMTFTQWVIVSNPHMVLGSHPQNTPLVCVGGGGRRSLSAAQVTSPGAPDQLCWLGVVKEWWNEGLAPSPPLPTPVPKKRSSTS